MDKASWLGAADQARELQGDASTFLGGRKLTVETMPRVHSLSVH